MELREQIGWEARAGRLAAVAAWVSAVLIVAGTIIRQLVALADGPDDEAEFLTTIDENSGAFVASAVIQSLSFLALAGVLVYLYRVTKARKPDFPAIAQVLAVLGPVLLAIAGPLSDLSRLDIADEFLASGSRTEKRAEDLLDDRSVAAAAIGSGGTLALAIAYVYISVNALRVGVLSRFMGIVGVIIGVLYVLPIFSGPLVVQLFWLTAIGFLFLGKWPGGRGPAWESGEAVPWPSAAERRGLVAPEEQEATEPSGEPEPEPEPAAEQPKPRKRKRKRR